MYTQFLPFFFFFSFFFFQYDIKYSGHENRPKNLLLKSVTTNVPSQDLILGSYFTNSSSSNSTTKLATATATEHLTTASAATTIDLDINVQAIKNMLMATRVPESCV